MSAQSKELDVVTRIYIEGSNAREKTMISPADGRVLPVHDHSGNYRVWIIEFSCEAGNERNDHPDLEGLALLYGCCDAEVDLVGHFVADSGERLRGH